MIIKGFSHIVTYFLYILSLLPLPILLFFARLCYYPLYYLIGYRKKVVRENLRKSFPDKSLKEIIQIEKRFYKYFTDLIFEIIKLKSISEKELRKRVKFNGFSLYRALRQLGTLHVGIRFKYKCYGICNL
jgi:KDO2-lipid IV(A) lauroyltransferase